MKDEIKRRIIGVAQDTWDYIAGDILSLMEEMGEVPVLTRDDVASTVGDRIEIHFGKDTESLEVYEKLDIEEKYALLLEAFPLKKYGW